MKTKKRPTYTNVEYLKTMGEHLGGTLEAKVLPFTYSDNRIVGGRIVRFERVWRDENGRQSTTCPKYMFSIEIMGKVTVLHYEHRYWLLGRNNLKSLLKSFGLSVDELTKELTA